MLRKLNGTSWAIMGRHERGKMTPFIDEAKKVADAFGLTLVSQQEQSALVLDTLMIERIRASADLSR